MVGDGDLVGFHDAVESVMPRVLADEYCVNWGESRPSSLLHARDLIWARGLLVTQAAELEVGLRELLRLVTTALTRYASTAHIAVARQSSPTGPGAVRIELQRLLRLASTHGLMSPEEVAQLRLDEVGAACAIRNQAAHTAIKTEYAYRGGDWQPIWSWFGDEATAEASDLAERLTALKDATTLVAHAYWPLQVLVDGCSEAETIQTDS